MNHPRILGIGTASPPLRLTQEQSFHAAGYQSERIRKIFLNSDIDYRHFYLEAAMDRGETSDQLNQRFLRGAMKTGCQAILDCVNSARTTVQDVNFLAVCTCTGYVCPDVGSRLIAHMGFNNRVQRASVIGLGCAGALPTLQRAVDFVRANPGRQALVLAVEICSACYYVDNTLETVVGNAICADGAAAFLLTSDPQANRKYPQIIDFTLCRRDLRFGRKSLLNPKNGREPGAVGLSAPSLHGRLEPTQLLSNQAAGNSQFRHHHSAGVPKTLKAGSSALFFITSHAPLPNRCPTVP